MDIAEMRQIPIADFLRRLGHEPTRRSGNELWYSAPYRSERTPSFRVNVEKNVWYDFGLGIGGDIFNLAGEFIHSRDFLAQVRFISESAGVPMVQPDASTFRKKTPEPSFEDVEVLPDTASFYCCQLNYYVHKKKYFAVGFSNVSGGYELRNRLFKGCIPPKDVSLIKRKDGQAESCSLYEGFMDFLSAVTLGMAEDGDSLVLNSVANVDRSFRYLDGYERIRCYLDNDEAGHRAVEKLRMRYGEKVSDCRGLYKGCKDLNEYLQQRINKQNNNKLKIR